MGVDSRRSGRAASRPSQLLRSKLRPPARPDYFVARPRLDDLLDALTARPLTLIVAPAGAGKTQVLVSWATQTPVRTAWLSLEESDDDPVELWTGVIAALDALAPGTGDEAAVLIAGRAPVGDVVRALLNGLDAARQERSALVIDDVHHVRGAAAADSFALFVQHLPAWLHVVVASRTDPRLPLGRMRGRGHLAEVRYPELRLTDGEARDVLARLVPDMRDAEAAESVQRTDGWAAGVQLVGLVARSTTTGNVPDAVRPDVALVTDDYVWQEVLATGDADVVETLSQVSVVDRFNGSLAAAITGRADVRDILVRGEVQGLFVHRLGVDGWFRIHPLVREALRNQLVAAGLHRELHERAARWLEEAGETVGALEQWLLAEQPREALRLVGATSTQLYDQGREGVIQRTIAAIPREVATADTTSLIDLAVGRLVGPRSLFVEAVREAQWYGERDEGHHAAPIAALQSMAATTLGDFTAGAAHARAALDDLGVRWWQDPAGRFAWNTLARCIALDESWADDDPSVRDATIAMSRDPRRGISLEGIRAVGHAFAGRPIDALRVAAGIEAAVPSMSILRVEVTLAESLARAEIGDRDHATEGLRRLADDVDEPRLFAPVAARLALADAAVVRGDATAATAELARAELLVSSAGGLVDLEDWVRRVATKAALARGDVDGARVAATAIADTFWGPASRARIHLALGERTAAAHELATASPRCPRHHVVVGLLRARAATHPDDVLALVTPAVGLASAHGLLQTVAADGRELVDAIERAAWRVPEEWLHRLRLAMALPEIQPHRLTKDLPEALTDREREVLRLLPSRLTLNEIAKELYVSVNTVKFHLRIIYRKLGVNSREEAAALARAMSNAVSAAPR